MKPQIGKIMFLLAVTVVTIAAQKTSDEDVRGAERSRVTPTGVLNKPEPVLQVVKVKGILDRVDLVKRTVTVTPEKKKGPQLELGFPQPRGKEQIKVSKKAAKVLGRQKLQLEDAAELAVGSKVILQYYPVLGQVMELLIDKPKL